MEGDCVVSGCAVLFQMAGWGSLAFAELGGAERTRKVSRAALLISICGLGIVMLAGAMLQAMCSLVSGLTAALLLLAVIGLPQSRFTPPSLYFSDTTSPLVPSGPLGGDN